MTPRDAAQEPLLRLIDVGKTYHTGEVPVPVLHDINLDIMPGELLVVVGPSGSGKSTLLNLIAGIDTPSTGEVWFQGANISRFDERALTSYRRLNIGFVFQFYNLVPTLTARENVIVSTEISDDPMDVDEALRLAGLSDRADHFPSQLSGGEQQRVAIARAIAKNPQLLLCDEPTGALDLETGRKVLGVLSHLNRDLGKTVIIITHNSAIAQLAERVVRLASGTAISTTTDHERVRPEEITW